MQDFNANFKVIKDFEALRNVLKIGEIQTPGIYVEPSKYRDLLNTTDLDKVTIK